MTLTVTGTVQSGVPPKVLVEVASSPPVTNVLRVWRIHQDGSRNPVLTSGRAMLNGTWSGLDWHAPFNETFSYVASTGLQPDSVPSSVLFLPSNQTWLMHPSDPDLSVLVDKVMGPPQAFTDPSNAERFDILNRTKPVHRWSRSRGAETGEITVRCDTAQTRATLKALLADGGPILLNTPWSEDLCWKWIQPLNVSRFNPYGTDAHAWRQVKLPYEETTAPDVDVDPVWTLGELKAEFTGQTLASLETVWDSFGDMRIDRRS